MKIARVLIGVLIAAIALYFTFRGIDLAAFTQALRGANWIWFVPAAGFFLMTLLLRAARWSTILGGTPLAMTFHAMNIGYMMNMLLPGRLGEIGRAYVISERSNISLSRAISSVVVERLLDLGVVILMLAASTLFVPLPPELVRPATLTGGLVLLMVVVIAVVIWQSDRVESLLRALLGRVPAINAESWIARFRDICAGFRAIGTPRQLLSIFGLTLLLWVCVIALAYALMPAFVPARLNAATLMVIFANLGGAIPTPGGIGPAQYLAKLALQPFGVNEAGGVAFVFVWSLSQILGLIVLGFVGLARVGMSFAQLRRATPAKT